MPPEPTGAPTMLIGELASRVGRSVHAVRWYCDQGLIPGLQRDAGGRRVFSRRHVEWLGLIERLRSTGMSIADIRAYTELVSKGTGSLDRQRTLLAAHRDQVVATIAGWQTALALIEAKLCFYEQWIATGERPARESTPGRSTAAKRAAARGAQRQRGPRPGP